MALMPEDLESKRFTAVRFTEGYEMDEVDDFLDKEVMPRLKELIEENERLNRELAQARARIAELESGEISTSKASSVFADTGAVETQAIRVPTSTASGADETNQASEIIAMAKRLHDDHVRKGVAERDRLIQEGNRENERIISEANETSRKTLEQLAKEKGELEGVIESLRSFERDYRSRLRSYLENQLQELDSNEPQESSSF